MAEEPHHGNVLQETGSAGTTFTFVLTGNPVGYPAGGYKIIFQLAYRLARAGNPVVLLFIKNLDRYLFNRFRRDSLLTIGSRLDRLSGSALLKAIYENVLNTRLGWGVLSPLYRSIAGLDYDYRILDGVGVRFASTPEEAKTEPGPVFATSWQTAYFVQDMVGRQTFDAYYIVQNSEDDFSFSGDFRDLASGTYSLGLKILVINHDLLERFTPQGAHLFRIGVDLENFRQVRAPEERDPRVIVFPARRNRGAEVAIKALLTVRKSSLGVKVRAYGNMSPKDVPPWVEFSRLPRNSKLAELYNSAAIFVHPALVDGMPAPPLEAMASGAAVVATNTAGTREFLVNESNGLLVPPGDSLAMAEAINRLLRDDALRLRLARNGRETALRFTYDAMFREFARAISASSSQSSIP